ncbi:MAG TPA: hypothetical protein VGX48_07020 [Pyrinomonadaceae bacterium]|jgi:hypothetical protein|nr:hypothetical protein [Pyrinomonadaceae bacterium]
MTRKLTFALAALLACAPVGVAQQQKSPAPDGAAAKKTKKKEAPAEADPMAEIRRTTAISLVSSLANDAQTFRDPVLRARVQARSADALWETDQERARTLFRRAWSEAESADAESDKRIQEEKERQIRERGSFSYAVPPSMRTEVLRLAAKRDRALGEEFLTRLDEARKREADEAAARVAEAEKQSRPKMPEETLTVPPALEKRLRLAIQLLEDGNTERAVQFADPALGEITTTALEFLTRLRAKDPKAADERYAAMVMRAAADPSSDPNTASLLSSYLFTPALYVTFSRNAGSSMNSWGNQPAPSDVSPQLRAAYFRVAASILLKPTPTPDQDRTTSGRAGWYMVIARLLPLFDQYAPDTSAALRAKMASLQADTPEGNRQPGNRALTHGLVPEDPNRDRVQESLKRLDNAKTSADRDAIYVDVVFNAVRQKDPRLEEFLNKIEDVDLRQRVRAYIDFEAAQRAVRDPETLNEALRLARGTTLTAIQRTWVTTEVAKQLVKKEPGRAAELLDEALREAREHIDPASPERVGALVAIATQLVELDRPRAWEVMLDVIKASNSAPAYTGEDGRLTNQLRTKNMTTMSTNSAESFDLAGVFTSLAREDMSRAVELARGFEGEAPRAVATLAIARTALEKK